MLKFRSRMLVFVVVNDIGIRLQIVTLKDPWIGFSLIAWLFQTSQILGPWLKKSFKKLALAFNKLWKLVEGYLETSPK